MKATIYDVARRAKVSITTVSRVLNGRAHVTPPTKARVLKAVEELNYRPNPIARGLAMQSTGTLSLLVQSLSGLYFAQIASGAETEAASRDYHLLVHQTAAGGLGQLSELTGRSDGIIISGDDTDEEITNALAREAKLTVILGHARVDLGMDGVLPDNVCGAYMATEHLIEHGCRRIAHIAGPEASRHAQDRRKGYLRAMEDHGLSPYIVDCAFSHYAYQAGEQAMHTLASLPEPPEAALVGDDKMAFGAYRVLEQLGMRIPDDIALIGFDGTEESAYVSPPLTTVYQPVELQGQTAVRLLLRRLANPDAEVQEIVLPTRLVIRRSCGCTDPVA